MLPRNHGVSPV